MSNNLDGHCGTIDLFENADPLLIKQTVDCRKRQGCSFSVMGARITTDQSWKDWRKLANSFWRPEYRIVPAAIITEKEINPGAVFSLPDQFRFLLIPRFTELPLELTYLELFGYIRGTGGATCLIPPLDNWKSPVCGLSNIDMHTVMINGKENISTALYHLNRRMKAGFIGINQIEAFRETEASFIHLFPVNYKLSEYNIFDCFRQGHYSVANAHNNFIRCRAEPDGKNNEDIVCEKIAFAFSCRQGKAKALLYKNGRSVSTEDLVPRPVIRSFSTTGKDYYYLKTSTADFCSISSPIFVRSPHQLWGDHHVHYVFKNGLRDARMDYIVHGLYGQVRELVDIYKDFPGLVPGGEIHGTTDNGEPDNLHFLAVQRAWEDHAYSWEPGEGNEKTLKRARRFGDFIILAHPCSGTLEHLPRTIYPDGIEILHGFTLFASLINNDPALRQKAQKVFGNELSMYTKEDLVHFAAALWDKMLCNGQRCLGVGDGDVHGLYFHGIVANNLGVGYPATVINAENAVPSKVHSHLYAGNAWCTNTGFVNLRLKLNGKEMGATADIQKRNHVELIAESCFPLAEIRFVSQGKTVEKIHCDTHGIKKNLILPDNKIIKYLRVELSDAAGNRAYANPVYAE